MIKVFAQNKPKEKVIVLLRNMNRQNQSRTASNDRKASLSNRSWMGSQAQKTGPVQWATHADRGEVQRKSIAYLPLEYALYHLDLSSSEACRRNEKPMLKAPTTPILQRKSPNLLDDAYEFLDNLVEIWHIHRRDFRDDPLPYLVKIYSLRANAALYDSISIDNLDYEWQLKILNKMRIKLTELGFYIPAECLLAAYIKSEIEYVEQQRDAPLHPFGSS